jgi:2-keto-4-pentenoate hydratase/2-oxohepta-3-ene-1,7-dioic acid hydratase in catechol pathway
MRLVAYDAAGTRGFGIVDGTAVYQAGPNPFRPERGELVGSLNELVLLPPVTPSAIVCVGLNYRDHAKEAGLPLPEAPLLFAKLTSAILAPGASIRIPRHLSTQIDYEAELAVVIGRTTSRVPVEQSLDHVFGYTCFNDVSARDLQSADGQWTRAKSIDTFGPIGPVIVTADEIPDPHALSIRCVVNDVLVQDGKTSDMVFGVAELISYISQAITLEAGDVIATGTPHGVGVARVPQLFLRAGDVVEVEISGIGVLRNGVEDAL